jgi:GNAT superfamily N-acetyltransferase
MITSLSFLIRDGLESDIPACLQLDHHYESDYVWQMTFEENLGEWSISFKTQHLPRILEAIYPASELRLRLALPADQCFLVAAAKEDHEILGYLSMRNDPIHRVALIQDIVVSRPYRRQHIGSRLVSIARQWAKEHGLIQFTIENRTQNHLGITFAQQNGFTFCGFSDQYFPDQDIAVFFGQSLR